MWSELSGCNATWRFCSGGPQGTVCSYKGLRKMQQLVVIEYYIIH